MVQSVFITALTLVSALALALVYGLGGCYALQRHAGRRARWSPLALLLTRLYAPLTALASARVEVMSALVSFERVFEVLDLKPLITEKPDAAPVPDGPVSVEFDDVRFAYPSADKVSLASLEEVATLDTRGGVEVLHDVSLPRRAGPDGRAGRLVRRGQVDDRPAAAPAVRRRRRRGPARRRRRARPELRLDPRARSAWSPRTATCSTSRSGRTCCSPGRSATEDELWDALRRARLADLVASLPDGLDTVVGERGYRLSGGERQRLTIARLLLAQPAGGDPRRGDRPPGLHLGGGGAGGAGRGAGRPDRGGHRAPAVDDPRRRPDPGGRGRPDRRARHATPSCWPPAAATRSCTAPSSPVRPRSRPRTLEAARATRDHDPDLVPVEGSVGDRRQVGVAIERGQR